MLVGTCKEFLATVAELIQPSGALQFWCRHLLLNLRLWSAAAPDVQQQLLALWSQLAQVRRVSRGLVFLLLCAKHTLSPAAPARSPCSVCLYLAGPSNLQGEPLLVHSLLPPAALLHHVRRRFFSGGSDRRARQQAQRAQQAQHARQARQGMPAEEDDAEEQPAAAASPGLSQEQEPAASDGLAADGELRRGYLRLACTIVSESATVADRGGAAAGAASGSSRQAGAPSAAAASDEGLGADLQAMLSLASDCCISIAAGGSGAAADAQLLQELLSLLLLPLLKRDSLARLPLLRHLQQLGGPALLLPLLRLEQQQLRLLGLRALAAALAGSSISGGAGNAASRAGGREDSAAARRRSVGSPPLAQQLQPAAAEEEEVVLAAGKLLSAFPLTAATRIALVELLCDAVPWPQVRLRCSCRGALLGMPAGWAAFLAGRRVARLHG